MQTGIFVIAVQSPGEKLHSLSSSAASSDLLVELQASKSVSRISMCYHIICNQDIMQIMCMASTVFYMEVIHRDKK